MKYVDLSLDKSINWPQKCAVCNQTALDYATTNCRLIDGFNLFEVQETTHSIRYPVCDEHKWGARFYGFVTNQTFSHGLVMMVALPFFLWILTHFITQILYPSLDRVFEASANNAIVAIFFAFPLAMIYWKFSNPVKLVRVKKGIARLRFRNEQYAEDFRRSNSQ
jgi:hypothetical protein